MAAKLSDRLSGDWVKPASLYFEGDSKITATVDGVTVEGEITQTGSNILVGSDGANSTNLYLTNAEGEHRVFTNDGTFSIYDQTNANYILRGFDNSYTGLYDNGVLKIRTTSTGTLVDGDAKADSFITSGVGSQASVQFGLNDDDNTGIYYRTADGYNQVAFSVDSNYIGAFARNSAGTELFLVGTSVNPVGNRVVGSVIGNGNININCGNNVFGCGLWGREGNGFVHLFYRNGIAVGSIQISGSSTSFNTSSDYRLKEDLQLVDSPWQRVKDLNVYNFAWKEDGSRTDGFIAHEVQAVVPESISGDKDAVDEEGNPVYQGIDQSKLVPLLTATLKEAMAKIEALESKVAALENS